MILIISIDNDTMTDEICSWLSFQNKNFVRLNENQHITSLFFDFKNSLYKISINHIEYDLNKFKSVFYRNGGIYYNFNFDEIDGNLTKFYNSEFKSITEFIYYYLETSGANIFGNLFTKEVNKLEVLLLAKSLGLKIPHTYILSQLHDISKIDFSQQYINKAISELKPIFVENELYLNYTREICIHDFNDKKENIIPSLIQEKVHKIYEVRIFFFIKKIWAIATFDFSNNIDIRNVKDCEKKYLPYKLPIEIEKKIHKLVQTLRLKCGTIDLIKSDNQYYFLEVNPLGQFSQVSYYGNYQIEKYIADLL